jgi:hypothetical protein
MPRRVRGPLFSEYVRMIRRAKNVDWERVLPPCDVIYLRERIDSNAWYPMATFERFGVAILTHIQDTTLDAVRLWGAFSAHQFARDHTELIAAGDPRETLMRLKVLRATLFDFPAFDIQLLEEHRAHVAVDYRMGPVAEEAACHQTMGFCEGVLSLAGVRSISASFLERSWAGDPQTLILLGWSLPGAPTRAAVIGVIGKPPGPGRL